MHLSSRAVTCPETVSRSHGPVPGGPPPVCLAARLEGDAAFHVIQPGDADWGIIISESWPRNHNKQAERHEDAPAQICKTDRCLHHSTPSGPRLAPHSRVTGI